MAVGLVEQGFSPGSVAAQTVREAGLPYDARVREPGPDILVVGGGPGGSTAATIARLRSTPRRSVLLADREVFPRDKSCGDAIPVQALEYMEDEQELEFPREGIVYQEIDRVSIGHPDERRLHIGSKKPFGFTSPRLYFDYVLFQNALKKGVIFERAHVTGPLMDNGRVVGVITQEGKELAARIVIDAGGATSPIARALRGRVSDKGLDRALAVRAYGELPYAKHRKKGALDARLILDYLNELNMAGYAWLFRLGKDPKTGAYMVNVGWGLFDTGSNENEKGFLRNQLYDYLIFLGDQYRIKLDHKSIFPWQIPFYVDDESRVIQEVPLVGDAGRNTDALTGGGIFSAMQTGKLGALYALNILGGMSREEAKARFDAAYNQGVGKKLAKTYQVQQGLMGNPRQFTKYFNYAYWIWPVRRRLIRELTGGHT